MGPVVERAPEFRGWRIRSQDQMPGQGMVVTDHWLRAYGFSKPSRFNIEKIVAATMATVHGYAVERADLEREKRVYGDPFKANGAADGIEIGEGFST